MAFFFFLALDLRGGAGISSSTDSAASAIGATASVSSGVDPSPDSSSNSGSEVSSWAESVTSESMMSSKSSSLLMLFSSNGRGFLRPALSRHIILHQGITFSTTFRNSGRTSRQGITSKMSVTSQHLVAFVPFCSWSQWFQPCLVLNRDHVRADCPGIWCNR